MLLTLSPMVRISFFLFVTLQLTTGCFVETIREVPADQAPAVTPLPEVDRRNNPSEAHKEESSEVQQSCYTHGTAVSYQIQSGSRLHQTQYDYGDELQGKIYITMIFPKTPGCQSEGRDAPKVFDHDVADLWLSLTHTPSQVVEAVHYFDFKDVEFFEKQGSQTFVLSLNHKILDASMAKGEYQLSLNLINASGEEVAILGHRDWQATHRFQLEVETAADDEPQTNIPAENDTDDDDATSTAQKGADTDSDPAR